jgi:predicted TIM-barrel fold metal-dependent hydrolase
MRTDVHQHLWSEPLVTALAARREPPRLRPDGARWLLELSTEPCAPIDVAGDALDRRTALVYMDGVDRALISLSPPLGIEALPEPEAHAVIDAYAAGIEELDVAFAAWASVPLADPSPAAVDAALDRGYVGLCLPAGALATAQGLERCGPLLEALERRDAPLFVHPGPDPWAPPQLSRCPSWWPAMTDYVTGMNAAWHAFVAFGRRDHSRLRVLFAMLAGGAPLHLERLAARGGPSRSALDPGLFYDTSSYGPRAIDAMVRVVGVDQIVYGSDRPVVSPPAAPGALGEAAWDAMVRQNPRRLLSAGAVPA